jgi:hypothetical protein
MITILAMVSYLLREGEKDESNMVANFYDNDWWHYIKVFVCRFYFVGMY